MDFGNQRRLSASAPGSKSNQSFKYPIFERDVDGNIVPDGMDHPGYVMDCMAYRYLDAETGTWNKDMFHPPREYFNCLRYIRWHQSGYYQANGFPSELRDINLKTPEMVSHAEHLDALNMAYILWAQKYMERVGIPVLLQQSKTLEELAEMGFDLSAVGIMAKGATDKTEGKVENKVRSRIQATTQNSSPFKATPLPQPRATSSLCWQPTMSSPSSSMSPDSDPFSSPLNYNQSSHAAATYARGSNASRSSSISQELQFRRSGGRMSSASATSNSAVNSLSHHSSNSQPVGRRLSGLAPAFQYSGTLTQSGANPGSNLALPQATSQLPSTFEIVSNPNKIFTILRVSEAPFNVTMNEILTHLRLGEREGIVQYGSDNPAIHIIQDRGDSKTYDVYVEMLDFQAARRVISDIPKRGLKIGSVGMSRKIRVEMVTRETMIDAIFPRPARAHARTFRWIGDKPDLRCIPAPFIGYVTSEDLHNAADWAEHPRKAKHAEDSPQRVYEFMITTLLKLPQNRNAYLNLKGWTLTQFVDRLFNTVRIMIKTLNHYVDDPKSMERHLGPQHRHMLNFRLLKRLNQTAYDFPLFTNVQQRMLLTGQL